MELVVGDVFRALDDETRRVILDELSARDGQTLFEICTMLMTRHGLSPTRQAISQHLGVLEAAGLVLTERRGRSKFHYFNREPLAEITRRWPADGKEGHPMRIELTSSSSTTSELRSGCTPRCSGSRSTTTSRSATTHGSPSVTRGT